MLISRLAMDLAQGYMPCVVDRVNLHNPSRREQYTLLVPGTPVALDY